MKKKTLILFDIDGTLLLSGGAGNRAIDRAFMQAFSLERATEGIEFVGMTDQKIFRQIISQKLKRDVDEEAQKKVIALYLENLQDEVSRSSGFLVLAGVRDLMEALSGEQAFLMGLVTGNFEKGARIKLKRAELDRYFSFGGFGEDGINRTDIAKTAVKRAAGAFPAGFEKIFVVGDSRYDVLSAQDIRAYSIAVGTEGVDKYGLKSLRPDFYFSNLGDTRAFLQAVAAVSPSRTK
jgi:phosphoglycolate phosphatase